MVNKLSDCSVTEYELWSISYQTVFFYRMRGIFNKLSDCSVIEYEVWSISYQTLLLQNTRYGQ